MSNVDQAAFEQAFWAQFESGPRQAIERACEHHLQRTRCTAIDVDDMISWAVCRVWKMVEERPNEILTADLSPEASAERIANASRLLARWAYLAMIRSSSRRVDRERRTGDFDRVQHLAETRSSSSDLERSETTRLALDSLRSRLNADLRGKLAASWKEPSERARIALALGADREKDDQLRTAVTAGVMRVNTVEKMRSRSLQRSRMVMRPFKKSFFLACALACLSMVFAPPAYAGGDDDGGEQTGGCLIQSPDSLTAR
ncbi:MAG TPA: hypothetical protein ENJ00_04980 [Phycisphaerales bacterium]|nr:hypothetical protein [Phycisphaerales bacterium]